MTRPKLPPHLKDHPEFQRAQGEGPAAGGNSRGDGSSTDERTLKRQSMADDLDPGILRAATRAAKDPRKVVIGGANTVDPRREFRSEEVEEYLNYIAKGASWPEAAELAGVTWERVLKRREVDPTLMEREAVARRVSVERLMGPLLRSAAAGNLPAIQYLFNNLLSETFAPDAARAKQAITIDGTVTHELGAGEQGAIDHIRQLEATLLKRQAALGMGDIVEAELVEDEADG